MTDLNNADLSQQLTQLIDSGLHARRAQEKHRQYLGASRLNVSCSRALQYEYLNVPKDPGKDVSGQSLRRFAAGHVYEALMADWLRDVGIALATETHQGDQFGFSVLNGKLQGHIDGVITMAPPALNFLFPMLWEAKSLSNASWRATATKGVTLSKPVYAGQIALYQAYMEPQFSGIASQPALFTAINKDTAELYFELIPFDGELAQRTSDRGLNIITACEAKEWLPRISRDPAYFECKQCAWQSQCWQPAANEPEMDNSPCIPTFQF